MPPLNRKIKNNVKRNTPSAVPTQRRRTPSSPKNQQAGINSRTGKAITRIKEQGSTTTTQQRAAKKQQKVGKGQFYAMLAVAIILDSVQFILYILPLFVTQIASHFIWLFGMLGFGVWLAGNGISIISGRRAATKVGNVAFGMILSGFYPEFVLLVLLSTDRFDVVKTAKKALKKAASFTPAGRAAITTKKTTGRLSRYARKRS